MNVRSSAKALRFGESVIREMSRRCALEQGVNLAQGFPDFPAPAPMKAAAQRAIEADLNQYSITWGSKPLRNAIAARVRTDRGLEYDPESEICVCCGATEAMLAAMLAVLDPGDEVLIFEPFYENYGPDCVLCGALPKLLRLEPPDWALNLEALRLAIGPRTRAIVVNTPHNPSGKVFTRFELEGLAQLCCEYDLLCITDEIYEYILYEGAQHISIASLPGMRERTITISGLSKTWSATGWRIGWCLAPQPLSGAIRKVHDFLTVGAPAPLQQAAAEALAFGPDYFQNLAREYRVRRDSLCAVLERTGFEFTRPLGAYYVLADFRPLALAGEDDLAFAGRLLAGGGVASVPGSSFFLDPRDGRHLVRFCFAKKLETLERAAAILEQRLGVRT